MNRHFTSIICSDFLFLSLSFLNPRYIVAVYAKNVFSLSVYLVILHTRLASHLAHNSNQGRILNLQERGINQIRNTSSAFASAKHLPTWHQHHQLKFEVNLTHRLLPYMEVHITHHPAISLAHRATPPTQHNLHSHRQLAQRVPHDQVFTFTRQKKSSPALLGARQLLVDHT